MANNELRELSAKIYLSTYNDPMTVMVFKKRGLTTRRNMETVP